MQAIFSQECLLYFKSNDPLLRHVDGFQIDPNKNSGDFSKSPLFFYGFLIE